MLQGQMSTNKVLEMVGKYFHTLIFEGQFQSVFQLFNGNEKSAQNGKPFIPPLCYCVVCLFLVRYEQIEYGSTCH